MVDGVWYSTPYHRTISIVEAGLCFFIAIAPLVSAVLDRPADGLLAVIWVIAGTLTGSWCLIRVRPAAVQVTPEALQVRNPFASYTLSWADVEGFSVQRGIRGQMYGEAQLKNGRRLRLFAIRRSASAENEPLIDALNQELLRRPG